MRNSVLPLSLIFLIILSSGCLNLDPQALALANPMIKEFLEEHPNADIKITHFSAEQAEGILDSIRADCENEYIGAKEFYRVNITDPDTNFYAVVWVDWESKNVECAVKTGVWSVEDEKTGKDISKPKEESGCKHHALYMCKDGDIYWYDSCRNREDKKEACAYGCTWGSEVCLEKGVCKSHAKAECYGDHVYWFDSCGHVQEKKEYCQYGCDLGFCKEKACEEHYEYKCHEGHLYWFDSCGKKEEKKEYCVQGCVNSTCIGSAEDCTEHSLYACYGGDLYWYDSCGNREEKKLDCAYACVNDTCIDYVLNCTSHASYACHDGLLFWYDSCGIMEGLKENCSHGCASGACAEAPETGYLRVSGRLTDRKTGNPLTGTLINVYTDQGKADTIYTDAGGAFAYEFGSEPAHLHVIPSCNNQLLIVLSDAGSGEYTAMYDDEDCEQVKRYASSSNHVLDLGEIVLTRTVPLLLYSDVPVSFYFYSKNDAGCDGIYNGGNVNVKNTHELNLIAVPGGYGRLELKTASSEEISSDWFPLPDSDECKKISAYYIDGSFGFGLCGNGACTPGECEICSGDCEESECGEETVTFNLHLRISECSTHGTDCDNDTEVETYGCALEGAKVTLAALNGWNGYSAQLIVNSGENSEVGMAPAGLPEWIRFDSIPVWTAIPDYDADEGFYRITVSKSGYTTKTGLVGIFGTTGGDLYWSREPVGNYICLNPS